MLKPPYPYRLAPMRLSDVPSIMAIERVSFPVPWKESAYHYEITQNRLAHYQVLSVRLADKPAKIIGYAGFWIMAGEAHISTIAVAEAWRGRGLGKLLLINLLYQACHSNADLATLEVRKSNIAAQSLYRKFRFQIVGDRRRYYQGKEDALIMTVDPLDSKYRVFLKREKSSLFQHLQREIAAVQD